MMTVDACAECSCVPDGTGGRDFQDTCSRHRDLRAPCSDLKALAPSGPKPQALPPLVYVAGPFSAPTRAGVEHNISVAAWWGVRLARSGAFPVVPHSNTSHPGYERAQGYEFWIAGTARLLCSCDAVFLLPEWRNSSGARGEEALAREFGLPVFEEFDLMLEWLKMLSEKSRAAQGA